MRYAATNWYWLVGNKSGVVFSSAEAAYVPTSDAGYAAFTAAGDLSSNVLCDGELADVLLKAGASAATVAAAGATSFGNLPPADAAAVLTAMGCPITSTSTPSLNATYAIDAATQQQVTSEALYVQVTTAAGTAKFTNGQASKSWPDISGAPHVFTPTQFVAFAETLAQQVDAIASAVGTAVASGQPIVAPAAPAAIP